MKKFTLYGKVTFVLAILFFILGIVLFVQNFNKAFIFKEQSLSLSFAFLGIALFFASFLQRKN